MGLSGGSTSTSNSVTGSAQAWAQPIATAQANATTGVYNQNQPQLQGMADSMYGLAGTLSNKLATPNPLIAAAQGYNTDVLSGKYLTGNPNLQAIIDAAKRGVTDSVSSQFAGAGRYGSGAYADVLSRNLAEAESGLRYTDYNTQQARMDSAASQAPALAQADYQGLPELLQATTLAAGLPYVGTSATAEALGALFNGGTQTSTQKTSGGLLGGLGTLLSGAAAISDRRLKTNIERVDELPDGLGIYDFDYVWGGERQRGVMADEVAELRPWALGPEIGGYATVDYSKLEAR